MRPTRAQLRISRCSSASSTRSAFRKSLVSRRAESVVWLLLVTAASSSCARQPAARDYIVGVHHVRLVSPADWEVLEQGRQHLFRRGEMEITLLDMGPATTQGMLRELNAAHAVWLAGRRKDAFERVRTLHGPPLSVATSEQRAQYWAHWYDPLPYPNEADSAAIGVAFDDLIRATRELPEAAPGAMETYVLESFPQADRSEVSSRTRRRFHGRDWTELRTWSRISHESPGRVAFVEAGGYLLVLAIERGPIQVTGPVFEGLLGSLDVAADSVAIR